MSEGGGDSHRRRSNAVSPDGPSDVGARPGAGLPAPSLCTTAACGTDSGIESGACQCRSVVAAHRLRKELGVVTTVVAFGGDATTGTGRQINDFIARAGGSDAGGDGVAPFAYHATTEAELGRAVQAASLDLARGSHSTGSPSSSWQFSNRTEVSGFVLDPRFDYPSWKGHLVAYSFAQGVPVVAWDAATRLEEGQWWKRKVYLDGSLAPVRIRVDAATRAVTNAEELHQLGLGASASEAEAVARWLLGDPRMKNPAVLGAPINSTPIEVGQPGDSPLPGGHEFFTAQRQRPALAYIGSDNGLLHAFFARDTTLGGVTHLGGTEAFAYAPREMLPIINQLYAQGGQHPDPARHIFGLANSAKVKNLCVSGCDRAETALWKTVLVMGAGFGGASAFALDITSPASGSGIADPPFRKLWSTTSGLDAPRYAEALGLTVSVPAFGFELSSSLDDNRMVFASGYPPAGSASTTQGRRLVVAAAGDGRLLSSFAAAPMNGTCGRDYALLADVATARNNGAEAKQSLLSAYVGDTSGNLWRLHRGALRAIRTFGCDHPLHYAPTVVQLDRDNPTNRSGEVYLAQVTNSGSDPDTQALPPSQLVVLKETLSSEGLLVADETFGTGGAFTRSAGTDICAVMNAAGLCLEPLPSRARSAGSPVAVLRADGTGFMLFTLWFVPDPNRCGPGTTYLTAHELAGGALSQKLGTIAAQESTFGAVFAAGKLWVGGAQGLQALEAAGLSMTSGGAAAPASGDLRRFRRGSWAELD